MDGQDLVDVLRSDHEAALAGLGSSKSLYALTGGTVDAEHVHAAAVRELSAARSTFQSWASTESDDRAVTLFETAAATVADQHDAIGPPEDEPRDRNSRFETPSVEGTAERLGAVLGWTLVTTVTVDQMVDFFVGHADPDTAETYRGVRGGVEHLRDRTATTIELDCESDRDWSNAQAAASETIEAADAAYRESLAALDVDPSRD
ncbi:MAG TPA: hypothetical protein VJ898_08890 [Natrialbaceae archaeon]|nr:hypothetical protein [Natrialbaceae archaeon]